MVTRDFITRSFNGARARGVFTSPRLPINPKLNKNVPFMLTVSAAMVTGGTVASRWASWSVRPDHPAPSKVLSSVANRNRGFSFDLSWRDSVVFWSRFPKERPLGDTTLRASRDERTSRRAKKTRGEASDLA